MEDAEAQALVERAVLKLAPMGAMIQVALRARAAAAMTAASASASAPAAPAAAVRLELRSCVHVPRPCGA